MLRNEPIRRPDTTPMGSLECAEIYETAEWQSHKDKSGARYRKSRLQRPGKFRSGVRKAWKRKSRWIFEKDLDSRSMALNRGHLLEQL